MHLNSAEVILELYSSLLSKIHDFLITILPRLHDAWAVRGHLEMDKVVRATLIYFLVFWQICGRHVLLSLDFMHIERRVHLDCFFRSAFRKLRSAIMTIARFVVNIH